MSKAKQEVHPDAARYAKHINPAFVKLLGTFGYGRVFVRAQGMYVWDSKEREYLDFLAAFGAANLGHNPPELVAALRDALEDDRPSLMHVGPAVHEGELGEALAQRVPELPMALLANSGGEAVEAALKLARAATKREGIVYCEGGFHGTGFGNLSIMGHERMREPFEPLVPGCVQVPFADLDALRRVLRGDKMACFVVEPIQAEAGVILPPKEYLERAREMCSEHGTLFVLDEVQTGIGRTGRLFAYQWHDLVPDVLVIGKSLGGSLVPVSAALTTHDLHQRAYGSMAKFDLHGSTYGGNALACRAAIETLRVVDDDRLVARAQEQGERLLSKLSARIEGHPLVREVRGRGLLVGLELGPTQAGLLNRLLPKVVEALSEKVFGQWLALRLLEEGILCQPASQQWNVLRLEPPLIVDDAHIDQVVETIGSVLDEYHEMGPLLKDVGTRLGRQYMGGWKFG